MEYIRVRLLVDSFVQLSTGPRTIGSKKGRCLEESGWEVYSFYLELLQ